MEHFEKHNRPFRLAIDVSIWHFQIQSGKGGSNPALRTLYYRLLRLLVLGIQPLFVFDGPNKPPFKRNMKTGGSQSASLPNYLTKQLLKLFGFPFHTAPGEAEAECALLQKTGIVDAVLSEDVDTMMFGCSLTLRNWSSEGARGNKTPTHVTCYDSEDMAVEREAGLDSEGMILVALMSGGDYIPAGVPRCGIKVACEAARAGFGRDLCRLSKDDKVGYRQWRERLSYELETNESKFFRVKHKALKIPENFPDMAVLGFYTNPAVSSSDKLRRLASEIIWDGEVDVLELRKFVGEAFDWHFLSGAQKFVRGLAPALLVRQLCASANPPASSSNDGTIEREMDEESTVMAICGRRVHFDSDGKTELRLKYIPAQIVGLDLELEEKEEGSIENGSESDADQPEHVESETEVITSRPKEGATKSSYDPTQPDRIWILEAYARNGVPNMIDAWEETMRNPKKLLASKKKNPTTKESSAKTQGRIDSFMKVSKPISAPPQVSAATEQISHITEKASFGSQAPVSRKDPKKQTHHHDYDPPAKTKKPPHRDIDQVLEKTEPLKTTKTPTKSQKSAFLPSSPATSSAETQQNPWTLSKRPSDTLNVKLRPGSRYSALGIYGSSTAPAGAGKQSNVNGSRNRISPVELEILLPLTPSSSSSSSSSSSHTSTEKERRRKPFNPYPSSSSSFLLSKSNPNPNPETIVLISSSPAESCHRFSSPGPEGPEPRLPRPTFPISTSSSSSSSYQSHRQRLNPSKTQSQNVKSSLSNQPSTSTTSFSSSKSSSFIPNFPSASSSSSSIPSPSHSPSHSLSILLPLLSLSSSPPSPSPSPSATRKNLAATTTSTTTTTSEPELVFRLAHPPARPLPPTKKTPHPTTSNSTSTSNPKPKSPTSKTNPNPNPNRKPLITLRESLDGAWRSAEDWEVEGGAGAGAGAEAKGEIGAGAKGEVGAGAKAGAEGNHMSGSSRGGVSGRYARKGVYKSYYRNVEVLDLSMDGVVS